LTDLAAAAPPIGPASLAIAASASRRSRKQNEKPTAEMQAIMKSNADASVALTAHVKEENYDAIIRDAATYKQNFAYDEAFWANKNVDSARHLARRGLTAAAELEAAALAKDDAALEEAMAVVLGTCGACHKQHREQLPDKTYEIRL
jgi:cytochrome c556